MVQDTNRLSPGVSVVVCCYKSAEVIAPTIKSLSVQEVPQGCGYDVILVDNNCTDSTLQLAKEAWENTPHPLRIVKEPEPGLIHARKTGVMNARFEFLLFVDDDNILEPDWVCGLWDLYRQQPRVGAIGGLNEPLFDGEKPSWFDDYSLVYACKPQAGHSGVMTDRKTLVGAGLSFRTSVIREIFSSTLPLFLVGMKKNLLLRGEDSELCLRAALMGWDLWYERSLRLKHYILGKKLNWDYVLHLREGGGAAEVILAIYRDLLAQKSPLSYKELSSSICREWEDFWAKLKEKDLSLLRKEGAYESFSYSYLKGKTDGLLNMGEDEYNNAGERIIAFFPKAIINGNPPNLGEKIGKWLKGK